MTLQSYQDFLATKRILDPSTGIGGTIELPVTHFPHQRNVTAWALRRINTEQEAEAEDA